MNQEKLLSNKKKLKQLQSYTNIYEDYDTFNFFIYQVFVASISAIVSYFQPQQILQNLNILNAYVGLPLIFGARFYARIKIAHLATSTDLVDCLLLGSSLNSQAYHESLAFVKMHQLRQALDYPDYLNEIGHTLEQLIQSHHPRKNQALRDFYSLTRHSTALSFFEKIQLFFQKQRDPLAHYPILTDEFYVDLCVTAIELGDHELVCWIYRDYVDRQLGSHIQKAFHQKIEKKLKEKGLSDLQYEFPLLQKKEPKKQNHALRLVQLSRWFGGDLVLTTAYIQDFLLRKYLYGQRLLMMFGVTLGAVGLFFTGFVGVCVTGLALKSISQSYLKTAVTHQNLIDLISDYYRTHDDRLLSLIDLKLESLIASRQYHELIDTLRIPPTIFEKRENFFILLRYLKNRRDRLSHDQFLEVISVFSQKIQSTDPLYDMIQSHLTQIVPPPEDQDQKVQAYSEIMKAMSAQDHLKRIFFPIQTVISVTITTLILFIPALALLASMMYTMIPAVLFLGVGLGLSISYFHYSEKIAQNLKQMTLRDVLSQKDGPYFEKIFFARIHHIEKEYLRLNKKLMITQGDGRAALVEQSCVIELEIKDALNYQGFDPGLLRYLDVIEKLQNRFQMIKNHPHQKTAGLRETLLFSEIDGTSRELKRRKV